MRSILQRIPEWCRGLLAAALAAVVAGCGTVSTEPLDQAERERIAREAREQLFAGQEPFAQPMTLEEATARAIKYQAEHRQRRMEEAAAAAQLEVAQWDMLPKVTANAGYSTRNNEAFSFGVQPDGTLTTSPSTATERTVRTANVGFAWTLLDFGTSYFRAKQLSDQKLIAEERRRKAVQILMHDVRIAWWRAEAAQRLLPEADRLLAEVDQAIEKTRLVEQSRLLPPVQTATLRRALLDLAQQIALHRQDLAQAQVELAALVNAPPGVVVHVASPASTAREVPDLTASLEQLDALALTLRPEMAEEGYRARISADEARKALLGVLPNVGLLGPAANYDSNRFLVNNSWYSVGVNVSLNLVKAFSIPALNRSEEAQRRADEARRQAMAMAVLTQTRIAAVRYTLVADEFMVWDEAARDDDLIVQHLASSETAGIDNELEVVRARARAMASHINRDLAYANLQAVMARLYNSVGYDIVPREEEERDLAELAKLVQARYVEIERASFSPRAGPERPVAAVGEVSGVQPRVAKLIAEGAGRVLGGSAKLADGAADLYLDLAVKVDRSREGRRMVHVAIVSRRAAGISAPLAREFKTTLSGPVDDEQWRALGEGAAYRMAADLATARITRPVLRLEPTLEARAAVAPAAQPAKTEPLDLRLEQRMAPR